MTPINLLLLIYGHQSTIVEQPLLFGLLVLISVLITYVSAIAMLSLCNSITIDLPVFLCC